MRTLRDRAWQYRSTGLEGPGSTASDTAVWPSTERTRASASASRLSLEGRAQEGARAPAVRVLGSCGGKPLGREPVRLGEHDVHADRESAVFPQRLQQLRHPRPRPRPLTEGCQAALVDVGDHDRVAGGCARVPRLIGVKDAQAYGLDGRWIDDAHQQ